jgi:hypothetical protein
MIFRSAFWLTVGFLMVAPHGTDFGAIASHTRDQVVSAGTDAAEQLIVSQILADQTLTKSVARSVVTRLVSSSTSPSADLPMQDSTAATFVFPRPRPAAMG